MIGKRAEKCAYSLRVIGHDEERIVEQAYIKGAIEQLQIDMKVVFNHLSEMQGEYITLELINELVKELKDETDE